MIKPEIKKSKLTNGEVMRLYYDLKNVSDVPTLALNVAISRTLDSLKDIVRAFSINNAIPKSAKYREYEKTLEKVYYEAAEGKTRIIPTNDGERKVPDLDLNSTLAIEKRKEVDEQYKEAIDERRRQEIEYYEFLDLECEEEFTIHKVDIDVLPEDTPNYKKIWDACHLLIKK